MKSKLKANIQVVIQHLKYLLSIKHIKLCLYLFLFYGEFFHAD